MNNILSLINPARIIKVEDAMKLAQIEMPIGDVMYNDTERKARAYDLLQSFESLYALKLEKGHFVCEVGKPVIEQGVKPSWRSAVNYLAYETQKRKILFSGFEKFNNLAVLAKGKEIVNSENTDIVIEFEPTYGSEKVNSLCSIHTGYRAISFGNATVRDLLHCVEVYNRTATTPIELKYTSNIFSLLKIEG